MKIKSGTTSVEITHPDKILFPKSKITKLELVEYYKAVAKKILPHIKDRPISMKRFPKGIKQTGFFQKNAPESLPSFVKTAKVKRKEKGSTEMILCNDTATLLWLANQNCITPHIWLSKIDKPDLPDRMIFDLDPPKGKSFSVVREGALALRQILEKKCKLKTFITLTGSRGLHVVVPIKRKYSFDKVRKYALEIAHQMVEKDPGKYTTEARKNKRKGRLYIDTMRNGSMQTVMAPYAVRPLPGAPIAAPITWEELKNSSLSSSSFTIKNMSKRLSKNPWSTIERSAKSLAI